MREVPIDDVFAAALPRDMDPYDPTLHRQLYATMVRLVWDQYKVEKPADIRFDPTEWLITNDADEADTFQPVHDCAACRAGSDQMRAFLREYPGRWVILGNMHYIEVWAE